MSDNVMEVYVDETSQTKHRYLALGALVISPTARVRFEENVRRARLPELPNGEMKWVKVSRSKLNAYGRVVDQFFDDGEFSSTCFHSVVVDTTRINDKKFNNGSRDTGFNKEIYQLLMKVARLFPACNFHVNLDFRDTKSETEELRLILNRGLARKGDTRDWPFRRVHFRKSHEVDSLQVTDVLLGAVAFQLNGHHLSPDASPSKRELSDHVLTRARERDVTRDTSARGQFTIWHRQLR